MRINSMSQTTLTISSRNYSSWSLRGWLMAKLARIDFEEIVVAPDDADARAEILLLSPSILVPCLTYNENTCVGHTRDRRIPERNRAKSRTSA
jgi:glutathione S-transferase